MARGKSGHLKRTRSHVGKVKRNQFNDSACDKIMHKCGHGRKFRTRDYLPKKLQSPRGEVLTPSDIRRTTPPRDETDIKCNVLN